MIEPTFSAALPVFVTLMRLRRGVAPTRDRFPKSMAALLRLTAGKPAAPDGGGHIGLDLGGRQCHVIEADLVDGPGEVLPRQICRHRSGEGWLRRRWRRSAPQFRSGRRSRRNACGAVVGHRQETSRTPAVSWVAPNACMSAVPKVPPPAGAIWLGSSFKVIVVVAFVDTSDHALPTVERVYPASRVMAVLRCNEA